MSLNNHQTENTTVRVSRNKSFEPVEKKSIRWASSDDSSYSTTVAILGALIITGVIYTVFSRLSNDSPVKTDPIHQKETSPAATPTKTENELKQAPLSQVKNTNWNKSHINIQRSIRLQQNSHTI